MANLYMLVSDMSKYIYKILIFIAIVVILDYSYGLLANSMIRHTVAGEDAMRYRICQESEYDIVILGSSRATRHYDDKMLSDSLHLSVINAGLEGNGIIMMYGLFHLISNRYKPSLIIYDIEPCFDILQYEEDDSNKRYLSGLKYLYDEDGITDIFKSVDRIENIKMKSNFYRYNSSFFSILSCYFSESTQQYGFEPHRGVFDPGKCPLKERKEREIDSLKLHYVEKMIDESKSKGINLCIVASPKFGADQNEILPIVDLCKEKKVQMWNFYTDSLFMNHPEYFNEPMHLNIQGAEIFSKKIELEINLLLEK